MAYVYAIMTLIKEGIITSILLIAIGVAGYVASATGEKASVTALIPAFIGLTILVSSLIAKKNLKAGMHLAAVFTLLGTIAPLGRLIPTTIKEGFSPSLPFFSQLATVIICGAFLALCVRSFILVRKARQNG